jgi:hypothetical protein
MDIKVKQILEVKYGYDFHSDHWSDDLLVMVDEVIQATKLSIKNNKFNFKQALIDYGFESDIVDDWIIVRKTKRLANTKTAFDGFIKEIETRCCNRNDVLRICVENSWGGFKWQWIDNKNGITNGKSTGKEDRGIAAINATERMLAAFKAKDDFIAGGQ